MGWNRATNHAVARDGRLERRYELCPACGRYWKDPWQYVCLSCEQNSDDKQAGSEKAARPHLTLVSSPDPEWTIGGLWYMRDMQETLRMGHMTLGTVFKGSQHGRLYVVVPAKYGQQLVPAGDSDDTKEAR